MPRGGGGVLRGRGGRGALVFSRGVRPWGAVLLFLGPGRGWVAAAGARGGYQGGGDLGKRGISGTRGTQGHNGDFMPRILAVAPSPLLGRRSGLSAERFDCCIPDGGLLLLYTDRALRERTHGVDDGMARLRSVALASIIRPASERAVRAST